MLNPINRKKDVLWKRFCTHYLTVIFIQEAQFFAGWALDRGHVKLCESCVSAIQIFPEHDLHPRNNSQVIFMWCLLFGLDWGSHGDDQTFFSLNGESVNWMTSLMSSMSASDRMTVALPLLGSLHSSIFCTEGCFSLVSWEAELHLLMQKLFHLLLMLVIDASSSNMFFALSVPKPLCLFSRSNAGTLIQ